MERSKHISFNNNFLFKKHESLNLSKVTCFLFSSACLVMAVCCFYLYYPRNIFEYTADNNVEQLHNHNQTKSILGGEIAKCDLFKGQWVPDARGSLYTNYSCTTIPRMRNCFLQGKTDRDFLYWRWKPDQCELPRFDPLQFLSLAQGKTMAFVGDSVARNQMESLLCLLSMAESPTKTFNDADEKFTTWEFPKHNFTLKAFWFPFLVNATERIVNGSGTRGFDLHLDKIDNNFLKNFPPVDYAVFSNGNWFLRPNYLYEGGNLLGCTYCGAPNITNVHPTISIGKAFRTAFKAINDCKDCNKVHVLLRTFSPEHFDGGTWKTGADCTRTRPFRKEEVTNWGELQYRNVQVQEFDRITRYSGGRGNGSSMFLETLDITEMMIMRPDGHPSKYWWKKRMSGYNDCLHWCLPGPIDTWNELLLEILKRKAL